jgi:hypothetical protein
MQITRDHLRFWERAMQAPRGHRQLLFLRTGKGQFMRHAVRWMKRLVRVKVEPLNCRLAIQQKVSALRDLHGVLAVALGEVHSQADEVVALEMSGTHAVDVMGSSVMRVRRVVYCLRSPPQSQDSPSDEDGTASLLVKNQAQVEPVQRLQAAAVVAIQVRAPA